MNKWCLPRTQHTHWSLTLPTPELLSNCLRTAASLNPGELNLHLSEEQHLTLSLNVPSPFQKKIMVYGCPTPLYLPSQLSIKSSNYIHPSSSPPREGKCISGGWLEEKKKTKQLQNGIKPQPTIHPSLHRHPLLVVDRLHYRTACWRLVGRFLPALSF